MTSARSAALAVLAVFAVACTPAANKTGPSPQKDSGTSRPGPDGGCVPASCGANACGQVADGCGAFVTCGDCDAGLTCGGGGANVCGTGPCTPSTCDDQHATCGQVLDGCGNVLTCGACGTGAVCVPRAEAQACLGNCAAGCPTGWSCDLSGTCVVEDGGTPTDPFALKSGFHHIGGAVTLNGGGLQGCTSGVFLLFEPAGWDGGVAVTAQSASAPMICNGGNWSYSASAPAGSWDVFLIGAQQFPDYPLGHLDVTDQGGHADFDIVTSNVNVSLTRNGAPLGRPCAGNEKATLFFRRNGNNLGRLPVRCTGNDWGADGGVPAGPFDVVFNEAISTSHYLDLPVGNSTLLSSWTPTATLHADVKAVKLNLTATLNGDGDAGTGVLFTDLTTGLQQTTRDGDAAYLVPGQYSTAYYATPLLNVSGIKFPQTVTITAPGPDTVTLSVSDVVLSGKVKVSGTVPPVVYPTGLVARPVLNVDSRGGANGFIKTDVDWSYAFSFPAGTRTVSIADAFHVLPDDAGFPNPLMLTQNTTLDLTLADTLTSGKVTYVDGGTLQGLDCDNDSVSLVSSSGHRYRGYLDCTHPANYSFYQAIVPAGTYDLRFVTSVQDMLLKEGLAVTGAAKAFPVQALPPLVTHGPTVTVVGTSPLCVDNSYAVTLSARGCSNCAVAPPTTFLDVQCGPLSAGVYQLAPAVLRPGTYDVGMRVTQGAFGNEQFFSEPFTSATVLADGGVVTLAPDGGQGPTLTFRTVTLNGTLSGVENCSDTMPIVAFKDLHTGTMLESTLSCAVSPIPFTQTLAPGTYAILLRSSAHAFADQTVVDSLEVK